MIPARQQIQQRLRGLTAPSARPRRLQLALALFAASCFGSAWMLGESGGAEARSQPLDAAAVLTPASAQAPAAAAPGADSGVPLAARPAQTLALAKTEELLDAESAADNEEATAPSQNEAEVIDSIDHELEQAPVRRKLSLPTGLRLKSSGVLVLDQNTGEVLAEQNADVVQPIASLTKLMTALVVLEARQPMDVVLAITADDIDREKHTYSRLRPGMQFTRHELLQLALMSSENRAASALGRNYPGGQRAFIKAMNSKAASLGMSHSRFHDASGLADGNVSTARDLAKLVAAAYKVPAIRELSTAVQRTVRTGRRSMQFVSSNRLIRAKSDWHIGLQKTGFTNEAGRCLVMQASVKNRPLIMVLLDSDGKLTRFADAQRVRAWVENGRVQKTASSTGSKRRSRRSAEAG